MPPAREHPTARDYCSRTSVSGMEAPCTLEQGARPCSGEEQRLATLPVGDQVHGLVELLQWQAMRDDRRGIEQPRL